jgi:hypothetical protein
MSPLTARRHRALARRTGAFFRTAVLAVFASAGWVSFAHAAPTATARPGPLDPPPVAGAPTSEPGEHLRLFLLTAAPGRTIMSRFGHSALWISDAEAGSNIAYNYGASMSHQLLSRLLQARAVAWLGGSDVFTLIASYGAQERSVAIQELNLSGAQKVLLRDALSHGREERMYFRYDFFRDNCATGARDILDRALGGAIHAATVNERGSGTYRSLSTPFFATDPLRRFFVTVAMGKLVDRPLSLWEEMFLPSLLSERLAALHLTDHQGNTLPLIAGDASRVAAGPAVETALPGPSSHIYLSFGTLLGTGMALSANRRLGDRSRVALRGLSICWLLLVGTMGMSIAILWIFTDQFAAHDNENILQMNPAALLTAPVLLASMRSGRLRAPVAYLAGALAGMSLLGLMLKLHPAFSQANAPIIALTLPAHLGLAFASWQWARSSEDLALVAERA